MIFKIGKSFWLNLMSLFTFSKRDGNITRLDLKNICYANFRGCHS